MTTNHVDAPRADVSAPPPARPAPPSNPLRLIILLGLLALVVGAYGYDFFVAKPACDAADKTIQEHVDEQNKLGVKDGGIVSPADIHELLGMQPTFREVHADKDYEVEYYCWWGHVPVLNTRRHFITVVYVGKEPRRFSSHHREVPPEEALPISQEPGTDEGLKLGQPDSAGPGEAAQADPAATGGEPAKSDEPAAAPATTTENKTDGDK